MVGKAIFDWCSIVTYENNVWLNIFITFSLLSIYYYFFLIGSVFSLMILVLSFFLYRRFNLLFSKNQIKKKIFPLGKKYGPLVSFLTVQPLNNRTTKATLMGHDTFPAIYIFYVNQIAFVKKV